VPRWISVQRAPITSLVRATVKIRNASADGTNFVWLSFMKTRPCPHGEAMCEATHA
jgi:hypothetical protein